MWRRYFAFTGIDPLVVYYEDLLVDAEASVKSVLQLLEVPYVPDHGNKIVGFRRQADDITESWVARYRTELGHGPYAVWRHKRSTTSEQSASRQPDASATVSTGPSNRN